ncbi:Aste57867_8484 [Aphanomyces stellatus]|uniref:Aste57867_8484 protein n=1 Tax=Aphanomyces stellatus TaxID=120398 RepID=A0A485KKH0_9STRA|nr:hypothetical protein As57867_008452 [Aphanomyces stellatus]VFT85370.1 Aste57867_8484 [Aphanomyces stellatus]
MPNKQAYEKAKASEKAAIEEAKAAAASGQAMNKERNEHKRKASSVDSRLNSVDFHRIHYLEDDVKKNLSEVRASLQQQVERCVRTNIRFNKDLQAQYHKSKRIKDICDRLVKAQACLDILRELLGHQIDSILEAKPPKKLKKEDKDTLEDLSNYISNL